MSIAPEQLAALAAVVHEGSFEAAARALHVTPSAVSQRIRALEIRVGQVLLRRAKPCVATEAGLPLLRLAGQIALLEREALGGGPGATSTRVPVAVNADSLATWFLPALAALPGEPPIAFDLREDDQDHTADWLRDGTVMAAVTATAAAVQGCRVRRLGAMRYHALGSPALLARWFGDGATAVSFGAAPVLVVNRKDRLQHRFVQRYGRHLDPPVHYVPSVWGYVEAIRHGLGWAMVPEQLAEPELAAGRMVDLAPGRHLDVPLYWQHWRLDSTALAALTDAVTAATATALR